MHELSIGAAVVDTAVRHAEGRHVTVVRVRVGRLRQVVPESLAFYFGVVARGSVCEGARLEIEEVAGLLRCRGCGERWQVAAPAFRCPACSGGEVDVEQGGELEVESIDVEEVAQPCTA